MTAPPDAIVLSTEDFDDALLEGTGRASVPLSATEVQAMVGQMVDDAVTYTESDLSPGRAKATDYYFGRPFGDEKEGRSKVVSRDVRDTVQAMLPSLMKVFFGPEHIVQFRPRSQEDVPTAEQQTEYINYIVEEDNDGFMVLHSAFKDALVTAQGVVKWWWEDSDTEESYRLTGVMEDQLVAFANDPTITTSVIAQEEAEIEGAPPTYTVDITRFNNQGRARIASVPPEEFVFTPNARSMEEALMVCHRTKLRGDELVAMGYPWDVVEQAVGGGDELITSEEAIARQPHRSQTPPDAPQTQTRLVDYYEAYVYIDEDGDAIAEHRRIVLIGSGKTVVADEPWPDRPFALFVPDPEPHSIVGLSPSNSTMEIQLVKSHILRGMLDSLAFSLHPRTAIVEGQVNLPDVLNEEIGSVIRERQPGMVREFAHSFVGAAAFPVLQYMDERKEQDTGMTKASMGLDPNALQSATRAAVAATVTASQQRLELLARIFAETGMKQLMQGLLKLVTQNQSQPRVIRLRNEYVPIDPRPWTADMDVTTNVALGVTLTEERITSLLAISQKQEQILQQFGPNNPLVTVGQYRNTLAKIIELQGYKNVEQFFQPVPIDFQPPQPPPKPTPEEAFMQIEQAKLQSSAQAKQIDALQQSQQLEFDYDKLRADSFLKAKDMELTHQVAVVDQVNQLISERGNVETAQ